MSTIVELAPVRIESGLLEGVRDAATGLCAWRGVPFAAPPVGDLRWRAPAPVAAWGGVRRADRFSPQCTQPGRAPDSVYAEYSGMQPMSEDCLYLNVWAPHEPAEQTNEPLPVMVWIHGGAFQQGAASNPVFVHGDLARQGVVLVTFNYRLGPFGFMAHPALSAEADGASGNYGLLDMAAALRWVQRNIGALGGDPARVTVFGQSAGAHGAIALMAAPQARGLFKHAIAQSFGLNPTPSLATGEAQGVDFAGGIGADAIATLRATSADDLMQRYLAQSHRFMPIVDGKFLQTPLAETFAAGEQQRVPFLTGWTRDEGSTFPAASSAASFKSHLKKRFGERAAEAEQLYPNTSDAEAVTSSRALFGDSLFGGGVVAAASAQAAVAPTWAYHFAQLQPFKKGQRYRESGDGDPAAMLGVFHSSEYPYVFGTTRVLDRDWGADDDRITALMQGWWANFAKTGNPNGKGDNQGLPHWPRFEPSEAGQSTEPTVLEITAEPAPIDIPRKAHLSFLR
jgi:para-nitrobenzyl esterase